MTGSRVSLEFLNFPASAQHSDSILAEIERLLGSLLGESTGRIYLVFWLAGSNFSRASVRGCWVVCWVNLAQARAQLDRLELENEFSGLRARAQIEFLNFPASAQHSDSILAEIERLQGSLLGESTGRIYLDRLELAIEFSHLTARA